MLHFKLQLGCAAVILYIIAGYVKESRRLGLLKKLKIFHLLLGMGLISVILDGATAYTVNNIGQVGETCNMILHLLFLLSLDTFIFLVYIYMLAITKGIPKSKIKRWLMFLPYLINAVVLITNIPELEYRTGVVTNYSMGWSAYTCFATALIYIVLALINFFWKWVYIEKHKRESIITYLLIMAAITIYQTIYPEVLMSSLCVTVILFGMYIKQENPAENQLSQYHEEMIMGFATLVENKDGSTGGHIKRTSGYVRLIVEELRRRGYYKDVLTKDYVNDLYLAAPMHDIGKVSIPDAVLQKPGKLTSEEFELMKQHTKKGGEIIKETFGHLGNESYTKMAYQVAEYHHEKWNGTGYPNGLKREEIPLCARIMAVADVFDAVSEKRCYREAMPLDKCFRIIAEGCGTDFDPVIADTFLAIREKVEQIHHCSGKGETYEAY